jgi:predicted AlkP superfamily pyrophosphatase or phosphodiesterase
MGLKVTYSKFWRFKVAFLISFLLLFSFLGVAGASQVLVVIWDGTEWTEIQKLYHEGKLPNLQSVGGLYQLTCNIPQFTDCAWDTCEMKTSTKSQHATMLTGFLADVHGVFSNEHYELVPDGLAVHEKIEAFDSSILTAFISSKEENFGLPTFGNIVEDVDYFIAERMMPASATGIAIDIINSWHNQDFFILCHFKKPDNVGHGFGIESKEYKKAIKRCDKNLGRMLDALTTYSILGQVKVYVLSDHGFGNYSDTDHGYAPNTFIVGNDSEIQNMYMDEVAQLFLANFGL